MSNPGFLKYFLAMKKLILLAGIANLANLNMQTALEINDLFKKSDQVHQLIDFYEIRNRFLIKKEKLQSSEEVKKDTTEKTDKSKQASQVEQK